MRLVGPAPATAGDATTKEYVDALIADLEDSSGGGGGAGGIALTPIVKSGAYTAAVGDLVLANAAGGAFTITAPPAATAGQAFGVMKTDTGGHPVTITGAVPINGDPAGVQLISGDAAVTLVRGDTGWWIYATAVTTPPGGTGGGGGGSSKVTAAAVALGTQPGNQSAFTWYTVPDIAARGLATLITINADGGGSYDLEVRGADGGAGSLWLQATGITTAGYSNPTPWYLENDAGGSAIYIGIRNTGPAPRTFTLAGLRVERFA